MKKLKNIEPAEVFKYFEDICAIPHGSGNTRKISDYCVEFAKAHNLEYHRDELNNVIIKKGANGGGKPIILQGHLDMVCEKTPECKIDFENDGLDIYTDSDYIRARGTTLGGGDGIAIAFALALLASDDLRHPLIEAVFTTDEETGMYGAQGLDVSGLAANTVFNIDSEDESIFTAGCAGGLRADAHIPAVTERRRGFLHKVAVYGLTGGHSGVEIIKRRANANKIIAELLKDIGGIYLTAYKGGAKTNAIPAYADAEFIAGADLSRSIGERAAALCEKYSVTDPNMKIDTTVSGIIEHRAAANTGDIIGFIRDAADGVTAMSAIEGLAETSSNLGIAELNESGFTAQFLIRSLVNAELERAYENLTKAAENHGGTTKRGDAYPSWEYREVSPLREILIEEHKALYGYAPRVVTIHAGLECGILAEKIPNTDCVSIGPDLLDIHTPNEAMSISSVQRTWELIKNTLAHLAQD